MFHRFLEPSMEVNFKSLIKYSLTQFTSQANGHMKMYNPFLQNHFVTFYIHYDLQRDWNLHWSSGWKGWVIRFPPQGNKSQQATSRAQRAVIRSSIILAWIQFETLGGEIYTQQKINCLPVGLSNIVMEDRWVKVTPKWTKKSLKRTETGSSSSISNKWKNGNA